MTVKKYDCTGCNCCEYVILRTKNKNRFSVNTNYCVLVLDRLPVTSVEFFMYHDIKINMTPNSYEFIFSKDTPIQTKKDEKYIYYRIDIKCKFLHKNKCKIYNRRPEICKIAQCPKLNKDIKKVVYENWKPFNNTDPLML